MKEATFVEVLLGLASLSVSGIGTYCRVLAQADLNPSLDVTGIVTQFGGLGFAIWLVYYHTTKTIPDMQKEHKAEREAAQRTYEAAFERQRIEFLMESKTQRETFEKNLERIACRAPLGPSRHPPNEN